jgi:iron complex transport system ATP-binding protein
MTLMHTLETRDLTLSYGERNIFTNLQVRVPKGKITVLIGSNGCGKSTLLRSMARLLKPTGGSILLNGAEIAKQPTKEIAKQLSILPQGPVAPEGLSVLQLVKQGRYPYQNWLQQWSEEDERMVRRALEVTRMAELAHRPVDSLSGGQRQRAWIAMTLAQGSDTLLLDEPTTYLDMTHQIEVLDLLFELNETEKRSIVMVLHDINLACRYAHHLVAVKGGNIIAEGAPEKIMTEELMRTVFDMDCRMMQDPLYGTPLCIPLGKGRALDDGAARKLAAAAAN